MTDTMTDEDAAWLRELVKLRFTNERTDIGTRLERIATRLEQHHNLVAGDDYCGWVDTGDDEKLVDEALRAIELGLQFAYENGLHEFGYDPVAVVRERIAARLEQHPNPEASK